MRLVRVSGDAREAPFELAAALNRKIVEQNVGGDSNMSFAGGS